MDEMILEEFIDGEEYAVDMFYNSQGEVVITDITHHPLPHKQAYFHSIYYTSAQIFKDFYAPLKQFFQDFNQHLGLRNFPIHAEFKGTPQKLLPIEMNPLRFGGFGLADLPFYMTGLNPFKAFFSDEQINWENFWNGHPTEHYAWVLGYKGTEIIDTQVIPNHQKFKDYLGKILHYTPVDHLKHPVFAMAYVELSDSKRVDEIKDTEFNEFFLKK
jgi:hypothetical protein